MNSKARLASLLLVLLLSSALTAIAADPVEDYRRAFSLFKQGKHQEAIDTWRSVFKANRKDLDKRQQLKLFFGMARAYEELGNKEKALNALSYAEKLAPGSEAISKARIRIETSGPLTMADALSILKDALLQARASAGEGRALFLKIKPVFEKAIEKGDDLARAHYALGTCFYYTEEDGKEAETHLTKSLELQPTDPTTNLLMADLQHRKGDLEAEIKCLEACQLAGMDQPELFVRLAVGYEHKDVSEFEEKIIELAEKAIAFEIRYGRNILEQISDQGIRAKVEEMIAKLEEEQRKKEEEKRKKEIIIVKYFGSSG